MYLFIKLFLVVCFVVLGINPLLAQVAEVSLEHSLYSVEEIDHHVDICTIVTMGNISFESPVFITTIGVSALDPEDYTDIGERVLTFQPGDTEKCVRVTIVEDDIVEGDESFTIVIQSNTVRLGTITRAEVTINDNSRITIGLVSKRYTVMEGRQVDVCVIIKNHTISREVEFTLEAIDVNGTASPGPANQDYIPITRTVGFNPSQPAMAACGTFSTTEDNIFPTLAEPDEFFIVTLRSSDNADVIEGESMAHVVIHDNDGASVILMSTAIFLIESDVGATTPVRVCLELEGVHDGLLRNVSFNFSIVGLSLASENDFSPQDTQTVTFPTGSSVGSTACAEYTILDDDLKEANEAFHLSVTAVNSIDIINDESEVTVSIIDDGDAIQECMGLPNPRNGEVLYSSSPILNGSEAVFMCNEGYIMSGADRISCLSNPKTVHGVWSTLPPVCNIVNCEAPSDLGDYGNVTYAATTFGSTATYTCISDCYELEPRGVTRVCQSNGNWSGDDPLCLLTDCGPPPNISGCNVTVEATSCGSEAMYEAHPGLIVKGDSTLICNENGEWSGANGFTMCKVPECPFIPEPPCGSVEVPCLDVGCVTTFSCDAGCVLSSDVDHSECQPNEKWDPPPPTCEDVVCPQLIDPDNGTILTNTSLPLTYHIVVDIVCNEGFRLEGSASRTCLSNGTWSGEETRCILIDCGPPTTENFTGEVDYSNTTNGSLALYTCQGNCSNASSICQENGEWTEVLLNCYTCPPLEDPENGKVNTGNVSFLPGAVATYTCDDGFVSEDTVRRNCTCDGWSGNQPVCQKVAVVPPGGSSSSGGNDVIIIVMAVIGGVLVLLALCVCIVVVWYCLIKSNSKRKDPQRTYNRAYNNYKGNTPYVLPYTVYANSTSILEPLSSNNTNSLSDHSSSYDNDPFASLRSNDSGILRGKRRKVSKELPSARGSEFGSMRSASRNTSSVRGSHFGVERMTSLGEFSRPGSDASTWEKKWAESSLFVNHAADGPGDTLDFDDTSSVVTTSTIPMSEYQRRAQTEDTQLTTKTQSSILKKK